MKISPIAVVALAKQPPNPGVKLLQDRFQLREKGKQFTIFDGHGGSSVADHLVYSFRVTSPASEEKSNTVEPNCKQVEDNLLAEYKRVIDMVENDREKFHATDSFSYKGCQACTVILCDDDATTLGRVEDGTTTCAVTATVGSVQCILSRSKTALKLSKSHTLKDPEEVRRIESIPGGSVGWMGETDASGNPIPKMGQYRVGSDGLPFARSIIGKHYQGKFLRPENAEVAVHSLQANDEFILTASDGLWWVMTPQEAIDFVHKALKDIKQPSGPLEKLENPESGEHNEYLKGFTDEVEISKWIHTHKLDDEYLACIKEIPSLLEQEARELGAWDDITVGIMWLNQSS